MRDEMLKGRKEEAELTGMTEQQLPFYDIIIYNAFGEDDVTADNKEAIKSLTIDLVELLKDAISKPNFWKDRDSEIRKLQGELDDMLDFFNVDVISEKHEKISVEIMNLAKKRHQELTGGK
jgi:type I restriction enzyme R subunit